MFDHLDIFHFLARACYEGLQELGFDVEIVDFMDVSDEQSIFITMSAAMILDVALPKRYIMYNWEQFTTDKQWGDEVFDRMRNAIEVWDYSPLNIKYFSTLDIHHSKLILPGYHMVLSRRLLDEDLVPRTNELFTLISTAMNERRTKFIDQIKDSIPLNNAVEIFHSNLTKIGLNIHYFGGKRIMEIHRIFQFVALKVLVLTERGDDAWLDDYFKDLVTFFDSPQDCIEKYRTFSNMTETEYQTLAMRRLQAFRKKPNFAQNFAISGSILYHWRFQV